MRRQGDALEERMLELAVRLRASAERGLDELESSLEQQVAFFEEHVVRLRRTLQEIRDDRAKGEGGAP